MATQTDILGYKLTNGGQDLSSSGKNELLIQLVRTEFSPLFFNKSFLKNHKFYLSEKAKLPVWDKWTLIFFYLWTSSDAYICISILTIIGSDNGLSPGWCQAIIWTNAGILLTPDS